MIFYRTLTATARIAAVDIALWDPIVAVRPRKPFVRYLRTMQNLNTPPKRRDVKRESDPTTADEPAKRGTMRRGVKGGSDGTQPLVWYPIEIRE